MANNSEINQLIIKTVENNCDDPTITDLIRESLQYELDIWNRHVLPSTIKDEYERMVDRVLKESEK
jgi:hypothetical protein